VPPAGHRDHHAAGTGGTSAPMFVTLFIETAAADLLAEEQIALAAPDA
jgi:hypothetical protein